MSALKAHCTGYFYTQLLILAHSCLLKRKCYVDGLCLTGYGAEDFFHSDGISIEYFFFNLKVFMQSLSVITLKLFRIKRGAACIQRSQPYGFWVEDKLLQ